MDDSVLMRVVEPRRNPAQVLERRRLVEPPAVHAPGQAAAGDVLHDHVGRPLVLPEVVNVDDVRVAKLGDRLGFVPEAGHGVVVRRDGLHHLDRARAL